ncbi:MAG: hypothetical protein JWQ17_2516 [Tardiphaga sp.]|jgi:hypothetical protein|nr:hypothetical protein [Tardiphaga sp.]
MKSIVRSVIAFTVGDSGHPLFGKADAGIFLAYNGTLVATTKTPKVQKNEKFRAFKVASEMALRR